MSNRKLLAKRKVDIGQKGNRHQEERIVIFEVPQECKVCNKEYRRLGSAYCQKCADSYKGIQKELAPSALVG